MDPVPDPLLLRKSGSVENRTRTSDHHRGSRRTDMQYLFLVIEVTIIFRQRYSTGNLLTADDVNACCIVTNCKINLCNVYNVALIFVLVVLLTC
jgi:hypothetical protein